MVPEQQDCDYNRSGASVGNLLTARAVAIDATARLLYDVGNRKESTWPE